MGRRRRQRRNWKWHYRKAKQVGKFGWKHRYATASLSISVIAGVLTDSWLSVGTKTQGTVALSVLAPCFAVWVYRNIGYGAIYVVLGLHPLTGKLRCIYVGLTTRPPWTDFDGDERYSRIDEHIFGSDRYRNPVPPKVWADTAVSWYFAHESWYFLLGVLKLFERINIKWRKPLYNDLMNHANPHRIDCSPRNPNSTAHKQRAQRDRGIYTQEYLDALQIHTPFLMKQNR